VVELRTITLGLAALPASRPVPRDMRITAEQAARLGRVGFWRRLLRPFGTEGLPTLRPIAATLTTLGLAGLLLTALPLGFGAGGAAILNTIGSAVGTPGAGAPVPAVVPSSAAEQQGSDAKGPTYASAQPAASANTGGVLGPATGGTNERSIESHSPGLSDALPQLPPLAWLSLGLVAAGIGLFALLLVGRRVA
ncbi:MAG TPA: hypothetical protein VJ506_12160, partial [Candidatus Limnocylindrales bacterium]|nr:hypothetical protein [Candidatus Limnocylindrales bacterium]